jgi:hypothetical protein
VTWICKLLRRSIFAFPPSPIAINEQFHRGIILGCLIYCHDNFYRLIFRTSGGIFELKFHRSKQKILTQRTPHLVNMKFLPYLLPLCFFLVACEENEDRYGFTTPSETAKEGDGIKNITIDLGRTVASGTTINYLVHGSAFLNGDYEIRNPGSVSASTFVVQVKSGESKATLSIELIDDNHVEEENESIYFLITGSSDTDLSASLKNNQYVLEIEDNDVAPTNGLQVDLSWNTGEGVSINTANFDLYLAKNVELGNNGQLLEFELMENPKSTNTSGFESIVLGQEITDEVYYVIINFVEGTSPADVFLYMSQGSQNGTASGHVNTSYIGKNVYYGPISKNGNSFSFRQ